jgi:integrase
MDVRIAKLLQEWHSVSKYGRCQDYIFATDANRAGDQRGRQPVSLAKVMQCRIQPIARAVGISKRLGWHTLRHSFATLLYRNREEIKVVQELLRHSSSRITMDIYVQAVSLEKRRAHSKVVSEL